MRLETDAAGVPPTTDMPHAAHRRGASISKRAGNLDGGASKRPEAPVSPPVSSSPVTASSADTLHQPAGDVDLATSDTQEAGQDGHALRDGFKRAYVERFLPRTSSDAARAQKQASPITIGQTRKGHRKQKSSQTVTVSQCALPEPPVTHNLVERPKTLRKKSREGGKELSVIPGESDSTYHRESSNPSSRSPSPKKLIQDGTHGQAFGLERPDLRRANCPPGEPHAHIEVNEKPQADERDTMTAAKSRRPLSKFLSRRKSVKGNVSPSQIPSSASSSTDRLPLPKNDSMRPSMPSPASQERFQSAGLEIPRKKDELGSIFRSLDSDYQKFASKPSPMKANIVKNSLLPFLKSYAEHPSWTRLRPEDLDRRIGVLNKWWTGMLELLSGKNGQSVSASDRPMFLEGISAIMTRPEWRIPSSAMSGVSNKSRTTIRSRSSTSVDSSNSDFLVETIVSNIRHIYVHNLLSQMSFVVERMSARSTPASVVSFCGKATAYAFFYCPSIAEILVRLWELPSDAFRRVLNEHSIPRNANLEDAAETVASHFPVALQSLAFTSVSKLVRYLRNPAYSPFDMSSIDWDGPWKSRWQGKESDLFYCFIKYYYSIVSGMLPEDTSAAQQIAAPASLLVQTQLLMVMDDTIRGTEQESQAEATDATGPVTFDEVLGPDASAEPLPGRVPNASRCMAENRLIMLLREVLSSSHTMPDGARRSFAMVFDLILKATAKRISLYDHNACFSLCDFLEESVIILARYYGNAEDPAAFLDWDFWLKVLRQMGESHNSTTDIRLYAFLYGMWGYIAKNADRKRAVCIDWLLTEEYATRQLCHWCPMVRAYFMRLVCWRIVRLDGRPAAHDLEIFKLAHQRLRDMWNYFLHNQHEASQGRCTFLSTAPANPAPQRRFMIMRNDSAPPPEQGFLSFDTMVAATSSARDGGDSVRMEQLRQMTHPDLEDPVRAKRNWLRGLKPKGGTDTSPLSKSTTPSSPSEIDSSSPQPQESSTTTTAATTRRTSTHLRKSHPSPNLSSSSPSPSSSHPVPASPTSSTLLSGSAITHSFKFSLEWLPDARAALPRERKLAPPNLPAPAQRCLMAHYPTPPPTQPQPAPRANQAAVKYSGRALAEWASLLDECRSFYERRMRLEGVPELRLVETPTLGVESFRRPVG